jgi:hypothetical protein
MGTLERTITKDRVALTARTIVGRSSASRVRLDNAHASGEHAALTWRSSGWHLRDLASMNGTWIDGARLAAGKRVPLAIGARIAFGDPSEAWYLADEGPPAPVAWDTQGDECVRGEDTTLRVGDAIVRFGDGAWTIQRGGAPEPIEDGALVSIGDREWNVLLPPPDRGTRSTRPHGEVTAQPLASSRLEFRVSSDEEHVDLAMRPSDGSRIDLPSGKSCYYVLLTLARMQLAAEERGGRWVDVRELGDALHYSIERVNVEIYRARKLLARAGVPDAFAVVERTRDGRLRVGAAAISVERVA